MSTSWPSLPDQPEFIPGTLLSRVVAATEHARAVGALQPIATRTVTIEQDGILFLVRVLEASAGGATACQQADRVAGVALPATDPFLPYDMDLFVANTSRTHVCLLNKFAVIDPHLLVVTRAFEDQEALLTVADFAALWVCLAEIDGLAFYNAGPIAGASQPHKHLQLVPLPPGADGNRIPIEAALGYTGLGDDVITAPGLPFANALVRVNPNWLTALQTGAVAAHAGYLALLRAVGDESASAGGVPRPYNLLVTRQWMLLVPRSCEAFDGMSVNALGYAGCLLVRDDAQLARLRSAGPLAALQYVGRPPIGNPLRNTVD